MFKNTFMSFIYKMRILRFFPQNDIYLSGNHSSKAIWYYMYQNEVIMQYGHKWYQLRCTGGMRNTLIKSSVGDATMHSRRDVEVKLFGR